MKIPAEERERRCCPGNRLSHTRRLIFGSLAAFLAAAALGGSAVAQTRVEPEPGAAALRPVAERVTEHAMVVTANPHATQAGLEMLRAGGSAVDAAAAAALALNVVEPQSSGIGGGAFALLALKGGEPVTAWDGREAAPAAVTPEWFLRPDGSPQPFFPDRITGGRPVGVPGLVKLLDVLLARYGKLGWPRVVQPALRLAEEGFPVSPRLAQELAASAERLGRFPATRAQFFRPDGSPLRRGDRLRQPQLARTLRRLAETGAGGFYAGPVAQAIVGAVNEAPVNPGRMSLADLAAYRALQRAPVSLVYRGYTLYGMGPPSAGGIAVLQTQGLLAAAPAAGDPPSSAGRAHRFVQATRLALADRDRYGADSDFVPVPVRGLLDPGYLASRAQALDWDAPLGPVQAGRPPGAEVPATLPQAGGEESLTTTHLTVVDAERNAVALTASIEQAFGSGMVVPGWGFLLNNELTDFDAQPMGATGGRPSDDAGHPAPNRAQGGKRPRSSMAPTLVFQHSRLVLALGSPGGPLIVSYVALTLERVLDEGLSLQAAIASPLLSHVRGTTLLEPEWRDEAAPALRKLGHRVAVQRLGSGLHGIEVDAAGRLHSGVDPRREGAAEGY